ncbi:MAG TPA: helix-turn-helix domain-containing protein [Geobacteraceae bacterium]|nr:helix-turn-helix domain-containing protein [Geobacteraceae bacterium]
MINNNKDLDGGFLSIRQLALYLNMKEKTLYARAAAREIPYYKIGRLLRFKKEEIDEWMHEQKVIRFEHNTKPIDIIRSLKKQHIDVDKVFRKCLDEVRGSSYSDTHGKPDRNVKGHGKEK